MRYSYEFKRKCVELYRQGVLPDTPPGVNEEVFRKKIIQWYHIEEACGPEALKPKAFWKAWTPEEKLELVLQVLAGKSLREVSYSVGMDSGTLYQWVRKYKIYGYNGLANITKGRPPSKESPMRKTQNPEKLTESEREELIRLRARTAYFEAENEVIKKEIALREEKEAARLKAKKQQSSKNSEKKDTN